MKTLLCLLVVIISFCVTGCYTYVPNMHNVPLFQEKKEARLSGGIGTCSEWPQENILGPSAPPATVSTMELQTAYSPWDHLGVMGNFIYAKPGGEESDGAYAHMFEIGAGYFYPASKSAVLEVYAGYGQGSINVFNTPSGDRSSVPFRRAFIQPNIGLTTSYIDFAFSLRGCLMNTDHPESNHPNNSYYDKKLRSFYTLEPGITLRGGWKYVKLQGQFCAVFHDNDLPIADYSANIGLYFSLADKFRNGSSYRRY